MNLFKNITDLLRISYEYTRGAVRLKSMPLRYLHHRGAPLLNPHLFDMLAYALERN